MTTLQRCSPPQVNDGSIQWSCPPLNIEGTWDTQAQPIRRKLFATSAGAINWSCLQPRAKANVSVKNMDNILGLGYVDYVEIFGRPWQLPIQELRWGRFLSEGDAILWIDVRGPHPQTLVFCNGVQSRGALVTDREITFDDKAIILTLEDSRVLREGALVSTALAAIPGISKMLPRRMLNTYECKWRSRGILRKAQATLSTGWVIHEVVRWP